MPSLAANVMHRLIRIRATKLHSTMRKAATIEEQVAAYRRELALDAASLIVGDCKTHDALLGGRPATWFSYTGALDGHVVLFLHGGGFVGGTLFHNRGQAADIARATGQTVVCLDYRLAPEHPFPAALDDTVAAYKALIEQGYEPGAITLFGCSAGGGLVLAAALVIREAGVPLPGAIVGFSPWCDLTVQQATIQANQPKDIVLQPDLLEGGAALYANGHDRTDPLMSPLFGELTGLPPLLLHVAAEELMLGEVIALADKAKRSGVEVELEVFDGLWHVFQAMSELVPEARAALNKAADFIRRHTCPGFQASEILDLPVQPELEAITNGLIHIYTGEGKGKTTASMGLVLRMHGHGRRVMLVQFLKNGHSGELAALRSLPGIHVLTGPENIRFTNVMSLAEKAAAREHYARYLDVATRAAQAGQMDLLVLDEVFGALATGMLALDDLLTLMKNKPAGLELVLTGRNPPEEILALADYISDIRCIRHPYERGIMAREGIEF